MYDYVSCIYDRIWQNIDQFDLGGEYVEGGSPCFQICLKFLKFKRLSKLSVARLKRVSETPQKSLDYGRNRQGAEAAKQI